MKHHETRDSAFREIAQGNITAWAHATTPAVRHETGPVERDSQPITNLDKLRQTACLPFTYGPVRRPATVCLPIETPDVRGRSIAEKVDIMMEASDTVNRALGLL